MTEARTLVAAGTITLDEYCAKLRMEQAALTGVSGAQTHAVGTSGAMRAGLQSAGFQVQDFLVQVNGGTDALRAFSMQAPQMIGSLQLMVHGAEEGGGKFAKFASILGGPWGVALGIAIPAGAMLIEKLWGMGDAADSTSGKLNAHKAVVDSLTRSYETLAAAMNQAGAKSVMALGQAQVQLKVDEAAVERLRTASAAADQRLAASRAVDPNGRGSAPQIRAAQEARQELQFAEQQLAVSRNLVTETQKRWQIAEKAKAAESAPRAATSRPSRGSSAKSSTSESPSVFSTNWDWAKGQNIGDLARSQLENEGEGLARQRDIIRSINDDISAGTALLNVEWETRGKSRQEIEAAVELKRFEIQLQRDGIDLNSEEAKDAMGRKAAQISFNQVLGESVEKTEALRDIGASAISTLLNPSGWNNWKSMVLGAINDVTQAFWKLAVINPIQNKLGGASTLPTIGNLLGLGKASGGVKGENLLGSAIGNNYTPAGAMLVGENGPEVVNMPRGAQVMTASDSRRMMSGQGGGLQVRVIKGDLFDVEVAQISAGVSADTVATAAPLIAVGASNGAQQAVAKRNGRRLA